MADSNEDLVFGALGGLGEIGMNCALYGFGPPRRRKWLMVDLGVSFAGPELPGVDLVLPDLSFIERIRKDLVALIITHAHEDHIGALADLWPRLECPVYASRFAISLAETRRLAEVGAPPVTFIEARPGEVIDLAPFSVEFVNVAHSIPESHALAIRTRLGTIVHSGDWKLDPQPVVGPPTDAARLKAIGDEGVLALVCDSTNILRDGESPSEADVAATLKQLIAQAPARVVVTTFASNIARIRSVAEAAQAAGRQVLCLGRAMDRAVTVARECGLPEKVQQEYFKASEDKIVVNQISPTGYPMRMLTSSPAIGSGIRPNCEAYGYLLDANGSCAYVQAYNREVAAHPGARRVSVMDKTCLCTHMRNFDCWTCGHYTYRLKDTSRKLEDGNYEILSAEHIFKDYQFSTDNKIALPD